MDIKNYSYYRHPVLFYSLATIIPWTFWFITAFLSHQMPSAFTITGSTLAVIGLVSPMLIAFAMIYFDVNLRKDFISRFFNFSTVKPFYLLTTCFLMLASILLAQAISLIFGYSPDQFIISG